MNKLNNMKYSFLLMMLITCFVVYSQQPNQQIDLKGKWELLNYNFESNSFESAGYILEFISDSECIQTEFVNDKVYTLNYTYSISSQSCGEFKTQENEEGSRFLVLNNQIENKTKCFLLSSLGRLEDEEEDQNIYLNLYPFGATSSIVFIKGCSLDSDDDGLNDCEDNYTTFNLDFFANYDTQNTDTSVSINRYISRITRGSVKETSFYDFNNTNIKRYVYSDGFVVYFSPKDLHAMEITCSAYKLSNGIIVGDDIAVLASNYPTEYANRNQTTKEVTVTVPITGAPDGTMVFHYNTNNKITKIVIELRAYQ